ncbi:MAG: MFS transporter [Negativicutes bacterium]|nr:MFS transporter [Negativicutes bacterium]
MKLRGVRWYVVALLMSATVINYLDRSCLSAAGPSLRSEFGIDAATFSYIVSAFQFSYASMMMLSGPILDWLGTRRGYALAVLWWSVANMLHGLATGWRSMAAFRGLLGIGESANFPAAIKTVAEWFPAKERTIATGILNTGSSFGAMLAPPLVIWLILLHSWQIAFVVTGAVGLVWVAIWLWFYQPPEKHKRLTDAEREYILTNRASLSDMDEGQPLKWYQVIARREFWAVAIARFFSEPAWQFFSYWIPMYLFTERGLDLKQIAIFAWMPPLAGDLGCLFGGFLSPFFIRRGISVLTARKCAATVSALIMVVAVFIGHSQSVGWAVFFFCVGSFAHQSMSSTLLTLPADLFPKHSVGKANGFTGSVGQYGGMLFTLVVGYVATHVGYNPLFVAIGCLDLVGAVMLWILLRRPGETARV